MLCGFDEKGPPGRNELVEKGHHGLSTLSFFRSHFSRRRPIAHFETTVLTEEGDYFPSPKDLVPRAGLLGRAPLDRCRRGRIAGACLGLRGARVSRFAGPGPR